MPGDTAHTPDILEAALTGYEAEGFDVFIEPSPSMLPKFMRDARPDAVALRSDRKIAIEVKRPSPQKKDHVDRLRTLFSDHPEWELRVLYVSPRSPAETINIATPLAINRAITQVERLKDTYPPGSPLIIGWSTLEAIARALLRQKLARPQPPTTLVETLASGGWVTPSEADSLRAIAAIRNSVAHGKLDAIVEPRLLDDLVAILRTLAGLIPQKARSAT